MAAGPSPEPADAGPCLVGAGLQCGALHFQPLPLPGLRPAPSGHRLVQPLLGLGALRRKVALHASSAAREAGPRWERVSERAARTMQVGLLLQGAAHARREPSPS